MSYHNNYWSCSRFADFVRGTKKLKVGTATEWNNWHKRSKATSRFRYWLAEEFLGNLQDVVTSPARLYRNIRSYYNNRWVIRSNSLTAHPSMIKRGEWRDLGNRFLPCMFNELVDFVEVESANSYVAWNPETQSDFGLKGRPPRRWRSAEAGIASLTWQISLVDDDGAPTLQADAAREILELYTWWTKIYPSRPDPMEASGWSARCAKERSDSVLDNLLFLDRDDEEYNQNTRRLLDECSRIEKEQDDEDTEMMCRLIKIRASLWT